MPTKSFTTAVAQDHLPKQKSKKVLGKPIEVDIDGRKIVFAGASSGQVMALVAMDGQSEFQRTATIINFFFSVIEKDSDRAYLKSRLFSDDDEFDEDTMADVVLYLVEEWTGRPTSVLSDSASTPDSTGTPSTQGGSTDTTPTPPPSTSGPTAS